MFFKEVFCRKISVVNGNKVKENNVKTVKSKQNGSLFSLKHTKKYYVHTHTREFSELIEKRTNTRRKMSDSGTFTKSKNKKATDESSTMQEYSFITSGATAAHSMGFKQGGLLSILHAASSDNCALLKRCLLFSTVECVWLRFCSYSCPYLKLRCCCSALRAYERWVKS